MVKLTENQQDFIVDNLRLSKAEIGAILQRDIQKIADLTKAQAFEVIAKTIENLIHEYAPGSIINIEIDVTEAQEGEDPVTFRGQAEIVDHEITITPDGCYLNATIHIPSLHRTIKRSLPYLKRRAKVTLSSTASGITAESTVARFKKLQSWHRFISLNLQSVWTDMLHNTQLVTRATKTDRLTPPLRMKFIRALIDYFQQGLQADQENLTEDDLQNGIRAVAGQILFK